ncbi:MAG: YicC/YloC family endoribonuclease [Rikenellaceae bacterium]
MVQYSMTGYGKGESSVGNKKYTVEIRTLNGKQLDLAVKSPAAYRKDEFEIRSLVSKGVVRGKCDVSVSIETLDATPAITPINREIFGEYLSQVESLAADFGFEAKSPEMFSTLLKMTEIAASSNKSETPKREVTADESAALLEATALAVESLREFRALEGKKLLEDILQRVDNIAEIQQKVEELAPEREQIVRTRLRESIESLQVTIDQNRFEQELIYYIEKYDITEEMVRLKGHVSHFHHVADTEEMCGRKLGFLSQELGREINTTGSKANHVEIQKLVVQMKDELEKIKEQSLNIL